MAGHQKCNSQQGSRFRLGENGRTSSCSSVCIRYLWEYTTWSCVSKLNNRYNTESSTTCNPFNYLCTLVKEKILLQENINIDPILFRGKVASTGQIISCGLFLFLNQFTEVTDGVQGKLSFILSKVIKLIISCLIENRNFAIRPRVRTVLILSSF